MPAMAATTPDTSRTENLIRRVLTPVNSAAVRLPPVASTCRPYLVLASTTAPTTTKAADQSSNPGIGPLLTEPMTRPTARPAMMPATRPQRDRAIAVQTLDRPATEPTLRSISAAAMTYVIATAITVM